jgi:alkylhydroperoxidase/carboxymuconolactone decarboxylase family protein YurZ
MKTFPFSTTLILTVSLCTCVARATDRPGPDPLCERALIGEPLENERNSEMPPKSLMMDTLYGTEVADKVYTRLQELDPVLNDVIQRVAYDHFWARPGLNIRDKSLVTVSSLIALGKEEQTRIHMNGFLNAGGTVEELKFALVYLSTVAAPETAKKGKVALLDVLTTRNIDQEQRAQLSEALDDLFSRITTENEASATIALTMRDRDLINVTAAVAIGDQAKTKVAIERFLNNGGSLEELKNTMIHQIVYCGFPAAMNGFAALQEAMNPINR